MKFQEKCQTLWFQFVKYEDFLLFFVVYDYKLNIFRFSSC